MTKYSMFWDQTQLIPYWKKASNLSPVGYWMLNDLQWYDRVDDSSLFNSVGDPGTGVTFEETGIGDGFTSALFDNTLQAAVVLASANITAFDPDIGTINVWAKVNDAAVWTDGNAHHIFEFRANPTNTVRIYKTAVNNQVQFEFRSGGTSEIINTTVTSTDWVMYTFQWSRSAGNFTKAFVNAEEVGDTTTLALWAGGALTISYIGISAAINQPWHGWIQHLSLYDSVLSETDIVDLYDITLNATVGDGNLEPYGAHEIQHVLGTVLGDGVITESRHDNPYDVSGTGVGTVDVDPGSAYVNGALHVSDAAETLNITTNAGSANPRLDYIVIERDATNQTVRLAIEAGVAAAAPVFPTLTDDQLKLWWLYVPAGFDSTTDTLSIKDVHDRRTYIMLGQLQAIYDRVNLLTNSELCAYSDVVSPTAPDKWIVMGAPTSLLRAARPSEQPRGNGAALNVNNINQGMFIRTWTNNSAAVTNPELYNTVKGIVVPTSGGATRITVYTESTIGIPVTVIERRFTPDLPADAYEYQITIETSDYLVVQVSPDASVATQATIGQVILSKGRFPGNFRPFHEIIMLDNALTDAAWTITAKSSGVTNIDLSASFGGTIPLGIRGLVVRMRMRDSGSAGATCVLYCYDTNAPARTETAVLDISGAPNNDWLDTVGYVSLSPSITVSNFDIEVVASGVGTADVTVEIIGIIT